MQTSSFLGLLLLAFLENLLMFEFDFLLILLLKCSLMIHDINFLLTNISEREVESPKQFIFEISFFLLLSEFAGFDFSIELIGQLLAGFDC